MPFIDVLVDAQLECRGETPAELVLMQCSLVVTVPGSSSPEKTKQKHVHHVYRFSL